MVKHWPFQMVGPRMTWCMSGIHTSLCRSPATSPCRGDSSSARLATTPATWQLPQVRTLALQWTILQLRGHCVSISWRKLLSWVYKQSFIRAPQMELEMLVLWKASLILETWLYSPKNSWGIHLLFENCTQNHFFNIVHILLENFSPFSNPNLFWALSIFCLKYKQMNYFHELSAFQRLKTIFCLLSFPLRITNCNGVLQFYVQMVASEWRTGWLYLQQTFSAF